MSNQSKPNRIKVSTETGFSVCGDAYEFASAVAGEYSTKAERAALVRLWPRMLGLTLTPIVWGAEPVPTSKIFRVGSRSSNTNSFGLTGIILVARDGECYEAATYLSPDEIGAGVLRRGCEVELPISNYNIAGVDRYSWVSGTGRTFEIPNPRSHCPAAVVEELFSI